MIAKKIYIFLLILINFHELRRTIFNKLHNLLKKESNIVYPIDKDNNRVDDQTHSIHNTIKEEVRSTKIYPKKNITNNILKLWKNYNDKKNKSLLVANIINKHISLNQKLVENNLLEKLRNLDTDGMIKLKNYIK